MSTQYCLRYQVYGTAETFVERCDSMTERELRRFELQGHAITLDEWLESSNPPPAATLGDSQSMARFDAGL